MPWKQGELEAPDFIRNAKALGVDGVELLDFFFRNKGDWRQETEEIKRALDDTGLQVGVFSVGNDFAQPNPGDRKAQVDVIKRGVHQAKEFGANVVRVFAGGMAEGHSKEEVFDWFVEGLTEASLYAGEQGIKLALENHGLVAGRSEQVCSLIAKVRAGCGDSTLGANPDTGNFLLVNEEPVDAVRGVAKYAYMCHFKDFEPAPADWKGHAFAALDGTKFIGSAIGEGSVDLASCVQELERAGFDGWLNIEYESEEDPEYGVPRSVSNARKAMG